jgi:hypothetical protein
MLIKAPDPIPWDDIEYPAVFLAGSIEQGAAVDWQTYAAAALPDDITVLNPRRDEWDASWEQRAANPQFREQVEWELDAMDQAALVLMHFEPDTLSPITLLELGLHAEHKKLIVSCPDDFWRKGNVEIVCMRYNLPLYDSIDGALDALNALLIG